ncbi:hypothetical protein L7F22_034708 [Adiantum nelumboides]|nr:hypothetical protein [Adiantum nelumboides]
MASLETSLVVPIGLKGVDITMISYLSELLYLANSVTTLLQSAEQHNRDVRSIRLIFAQKTREAIHILKMMLASMIVSLCQAANLRHLKEVLQETITSIVQKEAFECGLNTSLICELEKMVHKLNVLTHLYHSWPLLISSFYST